MQKYYETVLITKTNQVESKDDVIEKFVLKVCPSLSLRPITMKLKVWNLFVVVLPIQSVCHSHEKFIFHF